MFPVKYLSHPHSYELNMCTGSGLSKIVQFALPLACSNLLQMFFNAADIIVIGQYAGDNALAAVGSNTALIALLTNLFLGLSVGANILGARQYGAGQQQALHRTLHTALAVALCGGAAMTLVGVVGARRILLLMQCPPAILPMAVVYLRIYFAGVIASMVYNFGAAMLRAVGDTRRPLVYLLVAGAVNVILNLFFVVVCRIDVAGVALATVISQCISAALVVRCLLHTKGALCLQVRQIRLRKDCVLDMMRVGVPAGVQSILFSLSNVIVQASINSFGEIAMAGNTVGQNVEYLLFAVVDACYQANVVYASQNMGAGEYARIKKAAMASHVGCAGLVLLLSIAAYYGGRFLMGLYTSEEIVVDAALTRFRITGLSYVLCCLMNVIPGSIRGMGYNILPTVITLLGACGLRVLWVCTLFQLPQFHTIEMLYLCYPVSWLLTALAHAVCFLYVCRRLPRNAPVAGTQTG